MKKIAILILFVALLTTAFGQTGTDRIVDFGVRASANLSQPILHDIPITIESSPTVGVEGGVFLDFNIGHRFFVRFNTLYSLQRSTLFMDGTPCPLSLASVIVPVYALWRFGNAHSGWGFFGAGPYTEFITWGRLKTNSETFNPYHHVIDVSEHQRPAGNNNTSTPEQTLAMSDIHSGFGAMLGYELPCGLFVDFTAQMALTDMLAFDHGSSMWVRPLKLSMGIGWRW